MKKFWKLSLLIVLLLSFAAVNGNAQYGYKKKKKKKKKKEKTEHVDFTKNLWYGGGVNLGFQGGNGYSLFVFGISPMVGYKITDRFSAGPRVSATLYNFRIQTFGGVEKKTPISWSVAAFTRYQIVPSIFAHAEYEYQNYAFLDGSLSTAYERRNNFYLGVGYAANPGSLFRYELLLLYNFLAPQDDIRQPIDYRVAFTYNF